MMNTEPLSAHERRLAMRARLEAAHEEFRIGRRQWLAWAVVLVLSICAAARWPNPWAWGLGA